jgi:hypothetical protein
MAEIKKKNVNTSNLSLTYAQMSAEDFEKNLKKIGFEGDFKKAYAELQKRDKDQKERLAKKLAKAN